jgi:hypothetical protein
MFGYNKKTCVRFNSITEDKKLVFALCEKLRNNSVYILQNQVHTPFCETQENSVEFIAYIIEKMLYLSHPDTKSVDTYELVKQYFDWFSFELSNYEGLVGALNGQIC